MTISDFVYLLLQGFLCTNFESNGICLEILVFVLHVSKLSKRLEKINQIKILVQKLKKNFSRIDPEWIPASPGQSSSTLRERGCFKRTREIRERKILELETSRLHRDHGRVRVADLRRGCDATGEHLHFAF